MSDTTNTPAPATPSTAATEALIKDLVSDVSLIKQSIAAVKTGGVAALAPLAPQVIAAVEKAVPEVEAAVPEIKAGLKSTEWWTVIGALVASSLYFLISGKDIPVNLTVLAGSIISIYTVARTLIKAKTVAPAK